jgi:hypothetical protein
MQHFEEDDDFDYENILVTSFVSPVSSRCSSKQKPKAGHYTVGKHLKNQISYVLHKHLTKTNVVSVSAPMVR